jgi:hypothetical protein
MYAGNAWGAVRPGTNAFGQPLASALSNGHRLRLMSGQEAIRTECLRYIPTILVKPAYV